MFPIAAILESYLSSTKVVELVEDRNNSVAPCK